MPTVTLPDGAERRFAAPVSLRSVAESIGSGLAREALAGAVDGRLVDLCDSVDRDACVEIVTAADERGLEVIRHSCAHLLGQAVKQLFPEARMVIGPVIKDGFYYDIQREESFSPEDVAALEARMRELIASHYDVVKRVTPRPEALRLFRERGETYKVRLIEELPDEERSVGLYHHQEYVDMCRGPHVPNTRFLEAFALTGLSGAYWRGDAKSDPLQRIYGTAWASAKQLGAHQRRLAEAKKRDHRQLGPRLDLFHFQPEAPGMAFWHEKGWTLFRLVRDAMRAVHDREGYREVSTPQLLDQGLWERSGHWDKFGEMIFSTASERRRFAIKPMNCPGHLQIYNQALRSYRELPFRIAEFGLVHRNEPSGTLHGLMRARCFTQDDAHIICTMAQLEAELDALVRLARSVYRDFGFDDIHLALSTRPDRRVGDDDSWERAERLLEKVLRDNGLAFSVHPGEGAFYGPKIEFTLRDSIGREWQCGTVQLDFSMPERLGARYVDEDGARRTPVMIHRALLGSLERFIGILIEHHGGALPVAFAPVQAVVMTITDAQADYALSVQKALNARGLRVELDARNEKINLKIREHTLQKIPYLLVVGERERRSGAVTVRALGGESLGALEPERVADLLGAEGAQRAAPPLGGASSRN